MKLKLFGRKRELEHGEALEQLSPYIDGCLEAGDRTRLEQHLQGCQSCAAELEAMRATSALLRTLPPTRLPRDFTLQFAPRPVLETPRSFFALRLASGVAAAAFVALFAASALLPAVWAPQSDSTVTYLGKQQAPQTQSAPSTASSQADAAAPKRAAPAAVPAAPAAVPAAPAAAPAAPAAAPAAPAAAMAGASTGQSIATTPALGANAPTAPPASAAPAVPNTAAVAVPPVPAATGVAAPAPSGVPAAAAAAPNAQEPAPQPVPTLAARAAAAPSPAVAAPQKAAPPVPAAVAPTASAAVRPSRGQESASADSLSTQPALAEGRAAQPVAPPAAGRSPLQSLLTTLEVAAGSIALLLGLAAAAVWWKHKSLR